MDEAEYPGIRVNMTTTFDGVVTVSYTHLDVYKRQGRYLDRQRVHPAVYV